MVIVGDICSLNRCFEFKLYKKQDKLKTIQLISEVTLSDVGFETVNFVNSFLMIKFVQNEKFNTKKNIWFKNLSVSVFFTFLPPLDKNSNTSLNNRTLLFHICFIRFACPSS